MKHRYKILQMVIGMLFVVCATAGQTYVEKMDNIFEHVDKSKITTGLLSDYGLQLVDITAFDGTPTDSNYVDMDTWENLYQGLYSSRINSSANNLLSPSVVLSRIDNEYPILKSYSDSLLIPVSRRQSGGGINLEPIPIINAIPVVMMHFEYNKLNDEAVNLGLLQVRDNQIHEVEGASTPYLVKQLFAVAPKTILFDSPAVSFVFNMSYWFTNSRKTMKQIEVKFGDESDYVKADWDMPVSHVFRVGGVKTISFRLTYTDGTSYTSRTNVVVPLRGREISGGISQEYIPIPLDPTSEHSGGELQIRYASSNTSGQFRKTIIVAEGFDPGAVFGDEMGLDIDNFFSGDAGGIGVKLNILSTDSTTLLRALDDQEYDIVYVNNKNGVDDIRRNAKLFEEAIEYVNERKDGTYENVVLGISMGGLVARYALRKMEIAGKDHQTCKYISVDSPHKGANVPVAVQALIRHIENVDLKLFWFFTVYRATDINSMLEAAVELLNSKATKQLLTYYVTKDFQYDNSEHRSFMNEYEALGVPQLCQNIAVANGSNGGAANTLFSPHAELIHVEETVGMVWWMELLNTLFGSISSLTLLTNYPQLTINIIPGHTELAATVVANALPDRKVQRVYDGRIFLKKKILWLIPVEVDITRKTLDSRADMLALDGATGGVYDLTYFGIEGEVFDEYLKSTSFCFIPTVSALGLSAWEDRLTRPLDTTNYYAYGLAPFMYYFVQSSNEIHTKFDSSSSFLYERITSSCVIPEEDEEDVYIQNMTITSDRYFKGRNIYIGSGVTSDMPAGKVLITNGAHVVFDAKTVTIESGFECDTGSTYKTTTH